MYKNLTIIHLTELMKFLRTQLNVNLRLKYWTEIPIDIDAFRSVATICMNAINHQSFMYIIVFRVLALSQPCILQFVFYVLKYQSQDRVRIL